MSKRSRYILTFLVLSMFAAFAVWKYTFKKSESSVASRKTDVTIEAFSLLQAFEINEDSANVLYLDKILEVTGKVESVMEDSLGYSVYLQEKDALAGILCRFDKASFDPANVKPGSKVIVKGLCNGYLMDVILNKCAVIH